ncbi:TorF family putative porin [Methylosinus sp. RM1]|uniref:TorF family putative porin n=1 Tax=Methylosinus sp. RM1 TaxID=2583817 RepID=UPI00140D2D93|nr:TorF family putative porin [Methylosinus sp. RM1]
MKSILLAGVAAFALAAPAFAAEPAKPEAKPLIALPEPNVDFLGAGFDYAYGAKFMSDYIVRGISNSAHRPAGSVYGELRYGWFYTGLAATNVTLATSPLAEVDISAGIRPTWGPLTLDFGAVYYAYPSNHQQWFIGGAIPVTTFKNSYTALPTTAFDPSYIEIYFKPSWALNDYLTLGGQLAYAPNWNRYNAHALYSEINAKVTPFANTDYSGLSISGAFGHYYLGMSDASYGGSYIDPDYAFLSTGVLGTKGFKFASYNTWNVGASYNWNVVTLDLRYYDSNLTRAGCFLNTSDPSGNLMASLNTLTGQSSSSWCGSRFVASLSVDFSSATFK